VTVATEQRFLNRELSWLAFNERVLEEAADPTTPLLERLKFAAITASNLDEFFMVRVAGLKQAMADGDTAPDPSGMSPERQLDAICERAHGLVQRMYALTREELLPRLAEHGITLRSWSQVDDGSRRALSSFFRNELMPVLTPMAIDVSRPFPLVASLTLYFAVRLSPARGETDERLAILQVPAAHARLVSVPHAASFTFMLLEEIVRAHLADLFPGQTILESALMRVARDAELDVDDERGRTQLERVERELRRRRSGDVVRLEIEAGVSEELLLLLRAQLEVDRDDDIYTIEGPLDLRVLMALTDVPGFEALRDVPIPPVDVIGPEHDDLFALLDERDVLLHTPYDGYDPVVALVAQAASDPDVLAIKQTLYRASPSSTLIASLQRAAERQKQVTVLVEVTARFDEERNIRWARALEEAGAHVIYGVRGYKTHAKACLIVRRGRDGIRRYLHVATGNYNEKTARLYTDFGLMTSSPAFVEDATAFFTALTGYSDPPRMKKLIMAPTDLRGRLIKLIARERRRAEAGQPAEITAKMNSLVDVDIIEALYAASQAGVRISLNVRGICTLTPGVPGLSERIEVVSIVDRFLEHSRIYFFLNGGDEEVYLASADWMTRNFDRRIELMFPVEEPAHRARVVNALRAMFRDNVKGRWLEPGGHYRRRGPAPGEPPFRAQVYLQEDARRSAATAQTRAGVVFTPEQSAKAAARAQDTGAEAPRVTSAATTGRSRPTRPSGSGRPRRPR
jgi:polyphosphate kinase